MVVLGGGAVSYERGTPVGKRYLRQEVKGFCLVAQSFGCLDVILDRVCEVRV